MVASQPNGPFIRQLAKLARAGSAIWLAAWLSLALAAGDLETKFTNQGSIANTRHNLTQRPPGSTITSTFMDGSRNDYGEVCVYCHTPHGANQAVALPLWNHTIKTTTYTTYDQLGTSTLTQPVSQPGAASLSCLSCHDGQVAVDSIINMPGSGRYNPIQATQQDGAWLTANWSNPSGTTPPANAHVGLNATGCLACHSRDALPAVGATATDFTAFAIGTDLRNDHPVGVRFPDAGAGLDFVQPTKARGSLRWFDGDGNDRPDKYEIRVYDSGQGHEVECASCHDPHGVPAGGAIGLTFNPTFLRINNAGSAVCLTCHTK